MEESGQSQYLQLESSVGGIKHSPNGSGASSSGSPRSSIVFAPLHSMPEHQNNIDNPQLTQLSAHINYQTGVDSPPEAGSR